MQNASIGESLPPSGNGPHVFLRTVASNLSPNSSSSEGLISLTHESGPAPHHAFERLPAVDCAKFFTVHLRLLLPAERRSWGRLRPELIYSRVIAPMRLQHSSRRTAAGVLSGIKRANVWSPSRPRLMGRILGEDPMSNFVRAVSLRIGGLLVVLGGFLIFASRKVKGAKTESLPRPPAGGFVSSHIEFGGLSSWAVCRSGIGSLSGPSC